MDIPIQKPNESRPMKIQISANVSSDIYELARKHHLSWTKALASGLRIALNEKGEAVDYPEIELQKKLSSVMKQLTEYSQKYHDLVDMNNKQKPVDKKELEKELKEVFGEINGKPKE